MTEYQKDEQQVEDLDVPQSDAEDVKGGSLNFTRSGGVPQSSLKISDINSQKVSWG
jgi:hypothetical protein